MNVKTKCKKCGREFQIDGTAFKSEEDFKTANSTGFNTEERCSHCGYIATYGFTDLVLDTI
ncbi:MAG: hypothetical protein AB7V56_05445 [Candidatus Nitrosocosmicus sp.]|jgi:ribosomal protein L37E